MDGILLVNKPKGISSSGVVYKLRKVLGQKDIGHCGTLDPLAEGLLIIVLGKALKISRFIIDDKKEYIATCKLGEITPSLDSETEVIETRDVPSFDDKDIIKVLDSFKGVSKQVPPMYSAISVNGKKLYELARAGKTTEIPERDIEIYNIELLGYKNNEIKYKVECSKGTYIRTLCGDIASRLDNIGYMTSLIRTKIGDYSLDNSYTLEDIEKGKFELISIEKALNYLFNVVVANDEEIKVIKNGNILKRKTSGKTLFVDAAHNPIGMYEYDENDKVTKCIRLF